ncbi:MAG: TRAP transporter large permease subunit, partial [Chitinivibrionales bacterium]|nr:TRAP transporter large permease subunit [Chitinivibrionales bacterium]
MLSPLTVMILTFTVMLFFEVPIAVSLALSSLMAILAIGDIPAFLIVAQRVMNGMNSFTLLAIPFFILAGLFMGRGGIARRLIDFANALVGALPGGLAYVNVLTCMLFGSISGSSAAAVSSVGGFMIPLMNKMGYNKNFNASVTVTAATTGLLIPPSNAMIIYSLAAGGTVSIANIFIAGIIPGILVGLALITVAGMISFKNNYGRGSSYPISEAVSKFFKAIPALLLVVIILGGILSGIFTPTEASAIAVVYAFILSVLIYKEVDLREIPAILLQCVITTAVVFLLIGTSMATSWVLSYENIPIKISQALMGLSENKYIIFLTINLILLAVGTFMDMTPAILIFTPIFLPVVKELGMDPIQFG